MRHNRVRAGFLLIVILAAACGGDSSTTSVIDGSEPAPAATEPTAAGGGVTTAASTTDAGSVGGAAPAAGGTCTVTVTGDREESWTFSQDFTSFSSDYWISEEDLRETVEFLGEDIAEGSYEEIVARGEPIVTFLQVSCSNPDNLAQGALVLPGNATLAADLPMGPGVYPISGGLFSAADVAAGEMIANFGVAEEDELYGTVAGSGSLEIARWDRDRIEGSFSFDAQQTFVDENPKQVSVTVQFSFVCAATAGGC
jgi:hypothetical protein